MRTTHDSVLGLSRTRAGIRHLIHDAFLILYLRIPGVDKRVWLQSMSAYHAVPGIAHSAILATRGHGSWTDLDFKMKSAD